MRKTNVLKGLVCGLLFTAVAGSAVFAGTGQASYFIGNGTGAKGIEGNTGKYMVTAWNEYFEVEAKSTSFETRKFYVEATYRHADTGWQYEIATNSANLTNFMTVTTGLLRDKNDPTYSCCGKFIAYNSSTENSGIMDDYTIILKQRAND